MDAQTQQAQIGQGDIVIPLPDGTQFVLKPSIGALQTLSRKYGGLDNVLTKLSQMDFDCTCDVVAAGINARGPAEMLRVVEQVYAAGLTDDTGRVCEFSVNYIGSLMRGGRPLPKQGEPEQQPNPPKS